MTNSQQSTCVINELITGISLGSFKTRGLANQLAHLPPIVLKEKQRLVAMSAGNYGKAFAFAANQLGLPATVCMPDIAPVSRVKVIKVPDASTEYISFNSLHPVYHLV